MPLERLLYDAALHAATAAVDESNLAQARGVRGAHVFFDKGPDVARCEGVQIQRAFDRDAVRHAAYVAVTTVLMPPRTEKSPTTVMRRGPHAATRSSRIWFVTAS